MNYGGIKGTIITADANDKINITENRRYNNGQRGINTGRFCCTMRCRLHTKMRI